VGGICSAGEVGGAGVGVLHGGHGAHEREASAGQSQIELGESKLLSQAVTTMEGEDEMSEKRECEQGEAPSAPTTESAGVIRGIPSRRIESAGVLDLRGVPAERVAEIEHIKSAGVILVDEQNSAALASVSVESAGSVVVAPPDLRVLVQPDIVISKAMAEGMPPGQKLMMVGNVFIKPEVSVALVAEKFEDLHIVGILVAPESIVGALFGRLEITGITISLGEGVGAVVRSMGQTTITPDYLSRFEEGTTFVNIGQTTFASSVSEELVAQKIAAYHNVGQTEGPEPVLNLLKTRCPTNLGSFDVSSAAGDERRGGSVGNFGKRTLTRAFLERLSEGSSYENFGETTIADDVPEELLLRTIAKYTNFGTTIGPGALLAALQDRCTENFGSFVESSGQPASPGEERGEHEPSRGTSHLENHGEITLTRAELEMMDDGSHFENHGELTFAEDVSAELLSQKIGYYANHGTTRAPARLLAVLKVGMLRGRGVNEGEFEEC